MKISLAAAVLTVAPTPVLAVDYVDAYLQCVEKTTVSLGEGNMEPAETVLRAAYFECDFVYSMIGLEGAEGEGLSGADQVAREGDRLRQIAGDRAIAALLKARVTRATPLSSVSAPQQP